MKCKGLRTTCRECSIRFEKGYSGETCPECGADRKCEHEAVRGYDYCQSHGGPNPKNNFYGSGRGIVTGSRSKLPLTRIASKYVEMLNNGQWISNKQAVDILDQRILELASRIDEKDAPERIKDLFGLWQDYKKHLEKHDSLNATLVMTEIDQVFDAVYHDYASWNQMLKVLDIRRRHMESEVKILGQINAILTAEDAVELVAKVLGVIIHVEDDPKKLKRYQFELSRLIGEFTDKEVDYGSWDGGGEIIDAGPGELD